MPRIVDFSDGFTSASAPILSGSSPEEYTLLNNQASFVPITGLLFDEANETSVFIQMEIERIDNTPATYRQSISLIAAYDGSVWTLEAGPYIGISILADTLASAFNVRLQMNGGQVEYSSGNMTGGSYSGKFKLSVTRITV